LTIVILVNGMLNIDSGKTIMAYNIIKFLRKEGYKVAPFKPIGAVDIWRSSWVLKEIEENGAVVSGDAVILNSAIPGEADIRRINPIALILTPIDPSRFNWSSRPYENLMVTLSRRTSLMRLTSCGSGGNRTVHLVNIEALQRSPKEIRRTLGELSNSLNPRGIKVKDSDIERFIKESVPKAELCLAILTSYYEIVVIESHDDTAIPIPSALEANLVITVAPGKAAILDGEKFKKAVLALASIGSTLTLNSREILSIAGVSNEIDLPILSYPLQEEYPDEVLMPIINKVKSLIKE